MPVAAMMNRAVLPRHTVKPRQSLPGCHGKTCQNVRQEIKARLVRPDREARWLLCAPRREIKAVERYESRSPEELAMSSDENKKIVLGFFENLNAGNAAAALDT